MTTIKKTKTTTVKKSATPKRVTHSKAVRVSKVHHKDGGGTNNPGPGKKK